jgi:hypothetical protein
VPETKIEFGVVIINFMDTLEKDILGNIESAENCPNNFIVF